VPSTKPDGVPGRIGLMVIARKFLISGEVQGVGFRYFAQRSSARHQVRGYIKNLEDGRVEVHAEGSTKAVEDFRLDLAAGPTHSRVAGIEEIVLEPTGRYSAFRIER
jgi:acylphosphatase